jgi:hypothetical protein
VLSAVIFSELVILLGMFSEAFGHIVYVEVKQSRLVTVEGLVESEVSVNARVCVRACMRERERFKVDKGQWNSFYFSTLVFPCHFTISDY